jgi:hypothetical protein
MAKLGHSYSRAYGYSPAPKFYLTGAQNRPIFVPVLFSQIRPFVVSALLPEGVKGFSIPRGPFTFFYPRLPTVNR